MDENLAQSVRVHLMGEAQRRGIKIHESLFVELDNYSRHEFVCDLSERDLRVVIEGLGIGAMQEAQSVARAGDVRSLIIRLCNDPFTDCRAAAQAILDADELADEG